MPSPSDPHPGQRAPTDHLFSGIVLLVAGIVHEASTHPVTPWSFMPGQLLTMMGLGIGVAIWEHYQPRPGKVGFFLTLAGVGVWWISNLPMVSCLGPALYIGMNQLTRWVLKVAVTDV